MRNYFKSGDWNALCQRCGLRHKASELKLEWTGLHVCDECWEERHPLDFLRARVDKIWVPWVSPNDNPSTTTTTSAGEYINGAAINTFTLG